MIRSRLAPLVALTLALSGCWSVASLSVAAARVQYGIGDGSLATFSDPRFAWLGVKLVRLVVPYDVMRNRAELRAARAWLQAARAHHLRPFVAFSHSLQRPRLLPTVADYRRSVLAFRRAFPWVHDLSTWDEANHVSQPTARNPHRAALYFNALSAMCPRSCSIVAADVLDQPRMARWVTAFKAHAIRPKLWGLHNYYDLNHGGRARTSLLLRIVRGQLWFTETGGLVWRWDTVTHRFIVRGEAYAARAARHLKALVALSPRITRVYYYHWRIATTLTTARRHPGWVSWDSGLVRPDCAPRTTLRILAGYMRRDPRRIPRAVRDPYGNCSAPPPRPAPKRQPAT